MGTERAIDWNDHFAKVIYFPTGVFHCWIFTLLMQF